MFTLEQIKAAHAKVKTGADFPAYIRDIKELGVTFYETFVGDGHTLFHGTDGSELTSPSRYSEQNISTVVDASKFLADLRHHQGGGSDFFTFIRQAADSGIEKWAVCIDTMTCTYYGKAGEKVMVETIPEMS